MKKLWFIALIPGMLALVAVVIVITLLVVKLMWAWVVPDVFPGAVATGLIAREISWLTAFKIALVVGILTGFGRGGSRKS